VQVGALNHLGDEVAPDRMIFSKQVFFSEKTALGTTLFYNIRYHLCCEQPAHVRMTSPGVASRLSSCTKVYSMIYDSGSVAESRYDMLEEK
jgi:hypothetical protein